MNKKALIWVNRGHMSISEVNILLLLLFSLTALFTTAAFGQPLTAAHPSMPGFLAQVNDARQQVLLPTALAKNLLSEAKADSESQESAKNNVGSSDETKSKADSEEQANQSCIDCHNPDILKMYREQVQEQVTLDMKAGSGRTKPPFIAGGLNLAIDEKKYSEGVHGSTRCLDCHQDVKGHKHRLKSIDCKECHEESAETARAGAHGTKAGAKVGCLGCHDVHYGKGKEDYLKDFNGKICVDCHQAHGMDTARQHRSLYETRMHLVMDCMLCHSGERAGVHNIPADKGKVASCESCHSKRTILSKGKQEDVSFSDYIRQIRFINRDSLKKFGYVLGAHRVPLLDGIIILAAITPLLLCIAHAGMRIILRHKASIHRPEEYILLHPLIERIWHWVQAICTIVLIITGSMLHWPEKFPGWFDWAVKMHNWFGIATVLTFLVWLVYNLTTGRISHYVPRRHEIVSGVMRQARFYGYGIFRHEPHPHYPSEDNKFNPLQKIAYLQFQLFILPIVLASGLLYMYPDTLRGLIDKIGGMALLGTVHFLLGGLFAAFLVAHIYLATTGETIGENFRSIITGYGIKSHHPQ